MHYRFLQSYRHAWNPGHTVFPKGYEGALKREVVSYCLPRGIIEEVKTRGRRK